MQQSEIDSSNSAAVDQNYHWLPIDQQTPRGCKLQLINKEAGVAMYGVLSYTDDFYTHWVALPKFKDDNHK